MDNQGVDYDFSQEQTYAAPAPMTGVQVNLNDNKSIIVILLLVFAYPVGVVLMWAWMKSWPVWLKLLITIPILFTLLMIVSIPILFFLITKNTKFNFNNTSTFNGNPAGSLCVGSTDYCIEQNKRVYTDACQLSGGTITYTSYVLGQYSGECKYPSGKICDMVEVYNKTCNSTTAK